MRISLFGSYHGNNKGDEAILESLVEQIKAKEDHQLTVLTRNPKYIRNQYNVDTLEFKIPNLPVIIDTISTSDKIIIGGGGLFFAYDEIGFLNIWENQTIFYTLVAILGKFGKSNVNILGIGVHKMQSRIANTVVKSAFKTTDSVNFRDEYSRNIIDIQGDNISTTIDLACLLNDSINIEKRGSSEQINVGISVRSIKKIYGEEKNNQFIHGIKKILGELDARGYNLIFIPMNTKRDSEIADELPTTETMDFNDKLPSQIISEDYSKLDFVIGTRMHSIVFSVLSETPFMALSYRKKVENYLNEVGLESKCITVDEFIEKNQKQLERRVLYEIEHGTFDWVEAKNIITTKNSENKMIIRELLEDEY